MYETSQSQICVMQILVSNESTRGDDVECIMQDDAIGIIYPCTRIMCANGLA